MSATMPCPTDEPTLRTAERPTDPRTSPVIRSIIVTSNFPPVVGGSCQVYAAIAEQGAGLVHVLAPRRSFQTGAALEGAEAFDRAAGYPVHRIDLVRPRTGEGSPSPARDLVVMGRLLARLAWLCIRHRIHAVIIGDLIYAGWLAWPLRHILRRPVVFYVHGEEMTESAGGLFERLKGDFLRGGHAILAVSSFARDIAIAKLGADPGRVSTVLNGVDLATFHPRPRADDLADRFALGTGPVLLTVARLIERKGVDAVLRALPAIAAAIPDIRYLVAGDGPDRPRLEALAQSLGVAGRTVFTGRLSTEDLPRIYTLGDVFIMPNRRLPSGDNEGFGLVFLEASASGLPVIAGHSGGTADAVQHGRTGLLVDGTDVSAVADAAIALLSDTDRRHAMSDAGRAFAATSGWPSRFRDFQDALSRLRSPPVATPRRTPVRFRQPAPSDPAPASPDTPLLLVVIDAEEHFDWETYLADAVDVSNMRHLDATAAIFARHGIQPTYMIDYPVASQAEGYEPLRKLLAAGACTVGAQLHPWVNPPLTRRVSTPAQSYPGNLPATEERDKLTALTAIIERNLGARPRFYRAGRYGTGPNTTGILRDLGYTVDCSVLPCNNLTSEGGPDYSAWTATPAWLDREAALLEVPVTVGLLGRWSGARWAPAALRSRRLRRFRIPGILSRLGLLERIKLTPEGTTAADARRLTTALHARGQRVFVVTYHTSSLVPGLAPYVRTADDLERFLAWLDGYCGWFLNEFGGRPSTLDDVYAHALATRPAS